MKKVYWLYIVSFLIGIALGLSTMGCAGMDIVDDDPRYILVYRTDLGWGYWYNGIFYPAPPRYIYGRPINWGPRCRPPYPRYSYPRVVYPPHHFGGWGRHR